MSEIERNPTHQRRHKAKIRTTGWGKNGFPFTLAPLEWPSAALERRALESPLLGLPLALRAFPEQAMTLI